MEKKIGAWFRHPDMHSPDLNPRQPNTHSASMTAGTNAFPVGETLPVSSTVPHFRGFGTTNPPHGWFYCLPRFRQNFNFVPSSSMKKEISVSPSAKPEEAMSPNPKRFIVFDQSGGQTTMVYSSGIRTPVPCLTSAVPSIEMELEARRDSVQNADPVLTNESDDQQRADSGTDLHEDTDDINALLYSSDEDEYSENEEEASTGHSPCVIIGNDNKQLFEEIGEEVASSFGHAKRMKLTNGGYDVPSLHDNASSGNLKNGFNHESCSGDGKKDKRLRKDRMRETISILQKILSAGKSKDTIMILDEAIGYLQSLKHKALDLGVEIL